MFFNSKDSLGEHNQTEYVKKYDSNDSHSKRSYADGMCTGDSTNNNNNNQRSVTGLYP